VSIIGFVYNPGRLSRVDACRRGDAPSEFLYGAVELEAQGYDIRYFEANSSTPAHWPCAAFNFLRGHGPIKLDGGTMQATGNLLAALRECDVVIGTTGAHAFALSVWRSVGRLRPPIVGIQCGLLNHRISPVRRFSTVALMRRMQSMVFGESEVAPIQAAYPGTQGHVHVNQFGVDTTFWTPGPSSESGYILAVGNDGRRDYPTLIEAAKHLKTTVILVTSHTLPSPSPANVRHIHGTYADGVSDTHLRDLYRGAACVVVPLVETVQPSGQSVTLQAMACGRPVVLSKTQGIWSQTTVRDGETLVLTPPGSVSHLATAIQRVLDTPDWAKQLGLNAREAVLKNATTLTFANRLIEICERATAKTLTPSNPR